MADYSRPFQDLKLDTNHKKSSLSTSKHRASTKDDSALRPPVRASQASEETIRATPPIEIPAPSDVVIVDECSKSEDSVAERFLRTRQPSVSFNKEVKLDSGQRQSINEPLEKPRLRSRGRSLLQAIQDEKTRIARAHSESERTHFDPVTGRHLLKYSVSPSREHAHVGEGRFPLLQSTVDELARESHTDLTNAVSLTSDSTMSPMSEAVRTPKDERRDFTLSPRSSMSLQYASSYEEPKEFRRTASQRWRDGQAASDFFTRASTRNGSGYTPRSVRRETGNSIKSPKSAASSFLRAFSYSSGGDDKDENTAPDAEGQTIGENYVIGKQIGFGGFSVIKEATQMQGSGDQRKLAVKIVRRQIEGKSETENEQAQAEFDHEVELWRFLNHPNILPLEEVYQTDEATFCFIPLNTGGTLFDLIRSNRQGLPRELAQQYTYQLASALRYLHCDARVVHRDVKLENILLDKSSNPMGAIRLCDFGMAEWLSHDNENSGPPSPRHGYADRPPQKNIGPADTSTSAFAGGSLDYAAPEILRVARSMDPGNARSMDAGDSERAIVSPAVDVWALGVCVYSMVVGSRPFSNAFQPRVVMSILAGDWDREELRKKGGEDVLELTEGCLEMNEYERWSINDVLSCKWLRDVEDEHEAFELSESAWRL